VKSQTKALAAGFLIFFLALTALIIVGNILNRLPPYFDIGFKIIPHLYFHFLDHYGLLTTAVTGLTAILSIFGQLAYQNIKEKDRFLRYCLKILIHKDFDRLRKAFFLHFSYILFLIGYFIFVRTAFTIITAFDVPDPNLHPIPPNPTSIWEFIKSGLASPRILFFSGHTGTAFLGFLVFSENQIILEAALKVIQGQHINLIQTLKSYILSGRRIKVWLMFPPLVFLSIAYFLDNPGPSWLAATLFIWLVWFIFRRRQIPISTVFLFWSFILAFSVIAVRGHFTVDVVGAYFITPMIFWSGAFIYRGLFNISEKIDEKINQVKDEN